MENVKEHENTELGGVHLWSGVAIFWTDNNWFLVQLTGLATYLSWETVWSPGTATTPREGALRSFSCTRANPTHTKRSCNLVFTEKWQAGTLYCRLTSRALAPQAAGGSLPSWCRARCWACSPRRSFRTSWQRLFSRHQSRDGDQASTDNSKGRGYK